MHMGTMFEISPNTKMSLAGILETLYVIELHMDSMSDIPVPFFNHGWTRGNLTGIGEFAP